MKSATPARAKEDCYLAIEIGGTKLQVVAGTADGRFFDRRRFNVSAASGAEGIWAELSATLPALIEKHQPRAIGVGYRKHRSQRTNEC
jgi:predicted NBD/HSP70 family sugar kinase